MKSLMRATALLATLAMVFACTPESDGDGGGSGNNDGTGGSAAGGGGGPANEVNANIEGGMSSGAVSGSSEMSVPDQYYAAVADGALTVFLATESGIVQFTVDTGEQQAPGSYTVSEDLGGQADLSITAPTGIHMGTGGTISLSECPNESARVTGRFDNVSLKNVATDAADGALSGTWAATVVQSDGSANCAPPPPMMGGGGMMGGGEPGLSPGPMCPNEVCDGACCPLMPGLAACTQQCLPTQPGMVPDFEALATCVADCEQVLFDDPNCGPPFTALVRCIEVNECERTLEENPCLAANCCDEFTAAF